VLKLLRGKGYVIAQEFLPEAGKGNARPFLLAGEILEAGDMFLVGVDPIGDRIVEVNVLLPDALHAAERATGADFMTLVIEALERRVMAARARSG
jgi:glutathione synthase/RimK-type ligase-like ATP-grasp enzyme